MKLNRANAGIPELPIRIVHLGVGAFHRAHQVWYTQLVDKEKQWGIASFTGRTAKMAEELSSQDSLYTLITRDETEDRFTLMSQISATKDINEPNSLDYYLTDSQVCLVTLTITESGYTTDPDGVITKLARAIEQRRISCGEPLTIISCDNLSSNGERTRELLSSISISDAYTKFLNEKIAFISTSVDRITPHTTATDLAISREKTGWEDSIPVVTEPFTSWVLSGEFLTERPLWELAGAQFVEDIAVYENRKLWLLNGAHSYLAYRGLNQGLTTVAQAIADSAIRAEIEILWSEAAPFIDLDIHEYTRELLVRFENKRISYQLAQIAIDGSLKLKMRCSQVAKNQLLQSRKTLSYSRLFAEWIKYVRTHDFQDSQRNEIESAVSVIDYLNIIDEDFAKFPDFLSAIENQLNQDSSMPSI